MTYNPVNGGEVDFLCGIFMSMHIDQIEEYDSDKVIIVKELLSYRLTFHEGSLADVRGGFPPMERFTNDFPRERA